MQGSKLSPLTCQSTWIWNIPENTKVQPKSWYFQYHEKWKIPEFGLNVYNKTKFQNEMPQTCLKLRSSAVK